ncbi:MAG TPA: glutamate racemase [Gemmatimonadota bacterium]|nr:glutamate racemase [Gemmatimonadota bacterium]
MTASGGADRPVGIFDSGIGGLTVMHALMDRLPGEALVYFGDTARVPYGPKSPATVTRFAIENVELLVGYGVKAVVVACNTATAHALDTLRERFDLPIVGVVGPGARAAVAATRSGRVGVIGTHGTIASGAYERSLKALRPDIEVVSRACPLFVPLAEEGLIDHPAARLIAEEYLAPLRDEEIDTLILGCTHYPLLEGVIGETLGAGVRLIDSAEETARETATLLVERGLAGARNEPAHRWLVSDLPDQFLRVGGRFLGGRIGGVEVVSAGAT